MIKDNSSKQEQNGIISYYPHINSHTDELWDNDMSLTSPCNYETKDWYIELRSKKNTSDKQIDAQTDRQQTNKQKK